MVEKYSKGRPEGSDVSVRIQGLLKARFADPARPELQDLRYQLVHGCAAALIEAASGEAQIAVFIVYEFLIPDAVTEERVQRNAKDWNAFVRAMDPAGTRTIAGGLSGPFTVPGGGRVPSGIRLLLGKVTARVG